MASTEPWRTSMSLPPTLDRSSARSNIPRSSNSESDVSKSLDLEAAMTEVPEDPNCRPKVFRNAFQESIFIFTVMLATASTTFLQGVIIINTATIAASLHMTAAQTVWISAAIGLASGSFMLFFGRTADLFGRKFQLLAGMAFLTVISFVSAFAPDGISMDVLCGLLGLGTAAIAPPAIGTLFATYPEGKRRNKATGALGAGNPVGFILGSISAGVATKLFTWRASFIVVAIFFFVMTLLAFWAMPSITRSGDVRLAAKQFDYFGTFLIIVGMAMFSAALTDGPEYGWNSFKVITILVAGVACLLGFTAWEHVYTYPLLDPSVWKNKNFTLCILCTLFGYMSFITNQFWISLYMQDVQHYSPLDIAVRLLPQAVAGIIWSYVGQYLVSKVNGTTIMGVGALAYIAGAILLVFVKEHTSYWWFLFPSLCITVLGADFQFIVANLYINKQMQDQCSLAAGVLQTAMRLSISLGLAITSAVYISTGRKIKAQIDINVPFERAYFCSIAFAVIGLVFVPFMRINTQGQTDSQPPISQEHVVDERPPTAGENSIYVSKESSVDYNNGTVTCPGSASSLSSILSLESRDSYFPRFSWESKRDKRETRRSMAVEDKALYELCANCRKSRRVIVISTGVSGKAVVNHSKVDNREKYLETGNCR